MSPCAVVAGLPRTGTTLVMRMLWRSGFTPIFDRSINLESDQVKGNQLQSLAFPYLAGRSIKVLNFPTPMPEGEYVTILIDRDPKACVESQQRLVAMLGMKPITSSNMRAMIRKHAEQVDAIRKYWATFGPVAEVSFEALLADPRGTVSELVHSSQGVICPDAHTEIYQPPPAVGDINVWIDEEHERIMGDA
jgi:hypothetical protein